MSTHDEPDTDTDPRVADDVHLVPADAYGSRTDAGGGNERYRHLFELAPEPYLLTDVDGRISMANARTLVLFDRDRDEIEGADLADLVHPDDRAGLREQLDRAASGRGVHAWEVRLQDASESRALASLEPFASPDGEIEIRWALWDAMPLQLVRERLHALLESSQGDAAAMRSLAEWQASLLGSAAQDMRTPLSVISSTIDTLLQDGADVTTPMARSLLERASRQTMRLRRMLPTLLQLGRLQLEGRMSDRSQVKLHELVDEVLHDLEPRGHEITYQFEVDTVTVDPHQLARAVLELAAHAHEHGPDGATLRFGAEPRGVDVEFFLDVNGYAMEQPVREVVFSPFLGTGRGGEEANGDDLGLSLVAVFARMHGGRAWVTDAPGGGTSFRLLLSNALPDGTGEPT